MGVELCRFAALVLRHDAIGRDAKPRHLVRSWRLCFLALWLFAPRLAWAAEDDLVQVPHVSCPGLWYGEPEPAPDYLDEDTPSLPRALAERLAYYGDQPMAVLGPRGWVCFHTMGSGGQLLFVTPEPHDWQRIMTYQKPSVRGPFIQWESDDSNTSSRWSVAEIAARLFPVAWPYVREMMRDEGLTFKFGPFPGDKLVRLSPTKVEFITPGNTIGFGSSYQFITDRSPIRGMAMLFEKYDMDTEVVKVRLPAAMADLITPILKMAETQQEERTPVVVPH